MFYLPIFAAAQVDGLLEHFHALLRHEHADNARIRSAAAAPIRQNRSGRVPKISVSRPPVTIWQAMKVTKWSTFSGDFERERTTGRSGQRRVRFPRCGIGRSPFIGGAARAGS